MTLEQIKARYNQIADQRTRLEELRNYTHKVMTLHGVTRVADLPEGELEIVAKWGEGMQTPAAMARELAKLGRALHRAQLVQSGRIIPTPLGIGIRAPRARPRAASWLRFVEELYKMPDHRSG